MPESQAEFKILITGDANNLADAAKEGASALDGLKSGADGGKAALNDGLNPAVESFKKHWKAADDAVHETTSRGELMRMGRELGRMFPELGLLWRAAVNPIVGGFGVLLGVLEGVKRVFDGIIEASRTGIFAGSFRRNLDEAAKAATDAAVAFNSFERALQAAGEMQGVVARRAQETIDKIHAQSVAVAELDNAQKAAKLAQVNLLESEGKITQAEGIRRRMEIENNYAAKALGDEVKAKDAELDAKRKEVAALSVEADRQEENAAAAKKEKDDADSDLAKFNATKAGFQKALEDTKKQVAALREVTFKGPGWANQLNSAFALQTFLEEQLMNMGPDEQTARADAAKAAQEKFDKTTQQAISLRQQATGLAAGLPAEEAATRQLYIDHANREAANKLTRLYTSAGELAKLATQTSTEVNKNLEANKGVGTAM